MLITLNNLKSSLQAVKTYINNVLPKKVSDLVDDSGHYTKPSGGIPASDLADGVIPDLTEYAKKDEKADIISKEIYGSIASFADGADDMQLKSCVVNIEPIQEGTGDPSPENVRAISGRSGLSVVRCGKNLLPNVGHSETKDGITATYNNDGSITLNGTAEANVLFEVYGTYKNHKPFYIKNTSVVASGCPVGGGSNAYRFGIFAYKNNALVTSINEYGSGRTATIEECDSLFSMVQVYSGNTVTNLTFYPQLEIGSTASDYEPYEGNTYSVNWESEAGTVYGGTLDVVSGKLTVNQIFKSISDLIPFSYNEEGAFYQCVLADSASGSSLTLRSSAYTLKGRGNAQTLTTAQNGSLYWFDRPSGNYLRFKNTNYVTVDEFVAGEGNVQIVYNLAEPVEYQLSANEIRTLLGENNIWSDGGDISVEYPADTKKYIDQGYVKNTDYATTTNAGVVKINTANGVNIRSDNSLGIVTANESQIKTGTNTSRPITPSNSYISTFYGLAKAAGDITQSSSDNVVGNYTDSAKTAIKNMLGVPEDPLAVGIALPASADLNSYTTPGNYTADSTVIASITHAPTTTVEYKLTVEQISDEVIKQTVTTTETPANVYQRTGDMNSSSWVFGDWVKEIKSTDYATTGTGGQLGQPGIVKIGDGTVGIGLASNGELRTISASTGLIKAGTSDNRQISPMRQHEAVFYGLTKAAGVNMSSSSNAIGAYTDEAKSAIQNMLGVSEGYVTKDSIDNAGITGRTYTSLFGGQFSVTTATTESYINPYARATVTGRISKHYIYRVTVNETQYILPCRLWYSSNNSSIKVYEYIGNLNLYISNISGVPGGTDNVPFIIISDLNDSNSIDVLTSSIGTYNILIERINNTQIELPKSLIYGDAYEPIIKKNHNGTYNGYSFGVNELLNTRGTFAFGYCNKISNDFGMAFGINNESNGASSIALGMFNTVDGQGAFSEGGFNIASSSFSHAEGYETEASKMSAHSEGYQTVASGNASHAEGVGTTASGNFSHAEGDGATASANDSHAEGILTIAASQGQHVQGKYNIEDSNSTYAHIIGGGTDNEHRANIQAIDWDGNEYLKGDVYVNCAADSTDGTKLINATDYATTTKAGLVKVNGSGIQMVGGDRIAILPSTSAQIKAGTASYAPIGPALQHEATFYGLAKAAGDTTQSSSNNAVGTYTTEAKSAIRSMLGIENAATIIIEVQGTSPTITAQSNIRYVCGEVTSITITPPQIGICDVIFTSGSTPAILTLPNTVRMPDWVDLTILEANTIYEINIVDGIYGTVMTWKI